MRAFFVPASVVLLGGLGHGNDSSAYLAAGKLLNLANRESHKTVTQRKESVIDSDSDADSRLHTGSALAYDYTACPDSLTAKALHAEPLTG